MTFRPTKLEDVTGQGALKEALAISITSAKKRGVSLGHVLISGGPGLGKSTLAGAIANEMGSKMKVVMGSNIKSFKDILSTLVNLQEHEILFIDEIHRVNKRIAESLYTVMEDFTIDIPMTGAKGDDPEIMHIELPKFTMIGATTNAGMLTGPLLTRFKLKFTLELYDLTDLADLLEKNAVKEKITIDRGGLEAIAKASRGTPRIANALLEWVRDYGIAKTIQSLTGAHVDAALTMREIGKDGSTKTDRLYLDFLKKRGGGPVGVDSICSGINVDNDTVMSTIEPWLIQQNLIMKTRGGRQLL